MVGAASHSNLFLYNSMQLRTAEAVFRKRTWRASTNKRRNRLIWEHLDERMELLGHLKVILPLDIPLVEFDRTIQDRIFKRTVSAIETASVREVFSTHQGFSSMFLFEGTDHPHRFKSGVDNNCQLQYCVRSVAQELCHLNMISKYN